MSTTQETFVIAHRSELAALDQIRSELNDLSEAELLQQNTVPIDSLVTVRGVLGRLMALRPFMLQLPFFDIDCLDRLELYAMAFAGAQAQYEILKEHNKEPANLMVEGLALRSQLVNDLRTLVRRRLVSPAPLEKLRGGRGYKQVAADLLLLSAIFQSHLAVVAGKCATPLDDITRAESLADKLTIVVSQRGEPLQAEVEALKMRRRAFTRFFRAYNQVRRAVQYLRYDKGDADQIAPPLTGKCRNPKRSHDKGETAEQDQTADLQNATEQLIATGPDKNREVIQSIAPAPDPPASKATSDESTPSSKRPIGIGLPGSDPFLH